jgi:hypothetical protein
LTTPRFSILRSVNFPSLKGAGKAKYLAVNVVHDEAYSKVSLSLVERWGWMIATLLDEVRKSTQLETAFAEPARTWYGNVRFRTGLFTHGGPLEILDVF